MAPYTGYSPCSHKLQQLLAVAELEENTETFIKWYKENKQGRANISTLSQMDLPAGCGLKKGTDSWA